MQPSGYVRVEAHDKDGNRVFLSEGKNMVVNGGRDLFADLIADNTGTRPSHMAVGTGSTAITLTDTTLESEVDRNAIANTTSASGVVTYKCFWGLSEANGNTLANAGIFNAAAAGTMIAAYVLDSTVSKTAAISLTITWTITLADS